MIENANVVNVTRMDDETLAVIEQWRKAAPRPMGLNPFLIASEGDMSETAHSYALKELLNPERLDGLYLRSFVEYLSSVAEGRGMVRLTEELRGISLAEGVSISVEEPTEFQDDKLKKPKLGRIDVLIEANDRSWAIIVENKIKGAPDMPRQLYRYVKGATGQDGHKLNVKAIVYLKANTDDVGCPARGIDRHVVEPLFLPIAAFKEDEKVKGKSLEEGWLKKLCGEIDAVPSEDKIVIRQYIEVIARLREVMAQDAIYCKIVSRCGDMVKALPDDVKAELGKVLARRVVFNSMRGEFSSLEVYGRNPNVAVYDSLKLCAEGNEDKYVGLKLDVKCDKTIKDGKVILRLFSEKCCCSDDMGKHIRKVIEALGKDVEQCTMGVEGIVEFKKKRETGYEIIIDFAGEKMDWNASKLEKCISKFVEELCTCKVGMEEIVSSTISRS